jgi:hypothetical protein
MEPVQDVVSWLICPQARGSMNATGSWEGHSITRSDAEPIAPIGGLPELVRMRHNALLSSAPSED